MSWCSGGGWWLWGWGCLCWWVRGLLCGVCWVLLVLVFVGV
ncbi:hypothetical protein RA269_27640 [Pseudomonas syringae pv. tagetis]